MKKLFLVLAFLAVPAFALASTIDIIATDLGTVKTSGGTGLRCIKWSILTNETSAANSGIYLGDSNAPNRSRVKNVSGKIISRKWVPSSTYAPVDNADVYVLDYGKNNLDVLNGYGTNLPSTATDPDETNSDVLTDLGAYPRLHSETIELVCSNIYSSGDYAAGDFYLYIESY